MRRLVAVISCISLLAEAQSIPKRSIDRCAQDGLDFYALTDNPSEPVQVERGGVIVRIEHPNPNNNDAVITFSSGSHKLIQQRKDFEDALGWLTVSGDKAFATTWKFNASSARTQLYLVTSGGDIVEDTDLIAKAERAFTADARRVCRNPGLNTTAIKWIDKDHLLLSINAWASGFCHSNFTEGFILDIPSYRMQRKLSEQQLINLPAVCTWNLVPAEKH